MSSTVLTGPDTHLQQWIILSQAESGQEDPGKQTEKHRSVRCISQLIMLVTIIDMFVVLYLRLYSVRSQVNTDLRLVWQLVRVGLTRHTTHALSLRKIVFPQGGHQGEKYFFAFLDVSDHLEAKKINKWMNGKWTPQTPSPRPWMENSIHFIYFFFDPSPYLLF